MKKEHLTVLLEEMSGKLTAVLEGHMVLDRKIDAVRTDMCERFATVEVKLDALNDKIDAVDVRLGKRIDEVETKLTKHITAVAADLKAHRADTEAHVGAYRVGDSTGPYDDGDQA